MPTSPKSVALSIIDTRIENARVTVQRAIDRLFSPPFARESAAEAIITIRDAIGAFADMITIRDAIGAFAPDHDARAALADRLAETGTAPSPGAEMAPLPVTEPAPLPAAPKVRKVKKSAAEPAPAPVTAPKPAPAIGLGIVTGTTDSAVLACLRGSGEPLAANVIAERLSMKPSLVGAALGRLVGAGKLVRTGNTKGTRYSVA